MEIKRWGPLSAVITGPGLGEEASQTVVLLHGYGAPGTDLVGLASQIRTKEKTRFIFFQAPQVLPGMAGPDPGRAWWHIDMMALQVARMTGQDEMLAVQIPEGLDEARQALDDAFTALEGQLGFAWESTFLGGFSQGAMLACDYTLRTDKPMAGLIQLSGTVICQQDWARLMPARRGLNVFQSHSPDDQVLPMRLATRLQEMMNQAGLKNTFVSFRGGHGIGGDVLDGLGRLLG